MSSYRIWLPLFVFNAGLAVLNIWYGNDSFGAFSAFFAGIAFATFLEELLT